MLFVTAGAGFIDWISSSPPSRRPVSRSSISISSRTPAIFAIPFPGRRLSRHVFVHGDIANRPLVCSSSIGRGRSSLSRRKRHRPLDQGLSAGISSGAERVALVGRQHFPRQRACRAAGTRRHAQERRHHLRLSAQGCRALWRRGIRRGRASGMREELARLALA